MFLVDLSQQGEDRVRAFRIEVPRRLICQQHGRIHGQRSRNGHTLLLATAHVTGKVVPPRRQSNALDQLLGTLTHVRIGKSSRPQHGNHHIFKCGKGRDQVVILKNKANGVPTQTRQVLVIKRGGFLGADQQGARCGAIK